MLSEEALERAAVGLQTVGPEIVAYQAARRLYLLLDKGQRDFRRRSVVETGERDLLGSLERLQQRNRQPRMSISEAAAQTDHVHDRKNPRPFEPIDGGRLRIGKETADVWMSFAKAKWCARPDHRVEFPGGQHPGNRFAAGSVLKAHAGRRAHGDFFDPVGIFIAAAHPNDI